MDSLAEEISDGSTDTSPDPRPAVGQETADRRHYTEEFEVTVGTTYVTDESTGAIREMWLAEATVADGGSERYYGEHPADAVLGVIERISDGVV